MFLDDLECVLHNCKSHYHIPEQNAVGKGLLFQARFSDILHGNDSPLHYTYAGCIKLFLLVMPQLISGGRHKG